MIEVTANVSWKREANAKFTDGRYSRVHVWRFDGGVEVPASPSPHIVPAPYSCAANVDPEEAYVAALSSCHMLTFLYVVGKKGFVVDDYNDDAAGLLEKNEKGQLVVSKVTLNPRVTYAGKAPDRESEEALHHQAHEECFLANSVRTHIETKLP
jgi:organic hydroperoxide reductase OsmC/OhrA